MLHLYPQYINKSKCIIDDSESNLETSDIIYRPFTVGILIGPYVIDPADCWDGASWNVIDQVCEGFFRHNLTDPDMPRVNWLAESYWWENATTLHLKLREGVLFHDNTPFNSAAAKWNLDRINYLTNASGMLPDTMALASPNHLWKFTNGTGIMKQIDIVNEYNISIHLNSPFSPFLNLLSFQGAYMISPTSHSQTDYIDLFTGDLVGTGPFEYDGYDPGIEVNFHAFDGYWRGEANITEMKYLIINDNTQRNFAMLNGDIDYIVDPDQSLYSTYAIDPNIVFAEAPNSGLDYYYIGMNNNKINVTWRKAISYAINYSYIIQELRNNHIVRADSPIAPGFGDAYYNCSEIAPYYNLTIARQTLIDDPGIDTTGLTANDNPNDAAWEFADLGIFNYTYYDGSPLMSDLYPALIDWCDNIGITILDDAIGWNEWWDIVQYSKHKLNLFSYGWVPDYLDPFNMFEPLFSNSSDFNVASVNDPWLQTKLAEVIETTDDSVRNSIFHDIQIHFSSSLYPHAFLFHYRKYFIYNVDLTNYPHNGLGRLYFYPCEWIPKYTFIPPIISINSPTDNQGFADSAPMFNLTIDALDYDSIWYTLDEGITNITCGTSGQIDSTLWSGLTDDNYTLRFYANNSVGLIGTAAISIYKDTSDPLIIINSPSDNQGFAESSPIFDLTISSDYSSIWYTLDDGITNRTCGMSGQIDSTLWNGLTDGTYTLRFYANDLLGHIGTAAILIYKDTTDPVIIINDPDPG